MPTAANPNGTRLKPPATLSPSGRKHFLDIAATVSHLRREHAPLLAQHCEAIAMAEAAAAELTRPDADAIWTLRWEKSVRAMATLAMRLKLCPQAAPKQSGRPLSYYERMALENGDDVHAS